MSSNKETLFQEHIAQFLVQKHKFQRLENNDFDDKDFHFLKKHLLDFIVGTQPEKYETLQQNFGTDADKEIFKALKAQLVKKPLWLIMRNQLDVRGIFLDLYKPKPRSNTGSGQEEDYKKNIFSFKTEYYYSNLTSERIDLVIWLNGLPIIVIELKHEDEGQTVEDAIYDSFLNRDLGNKLYNMPFLYIALSNTEAKMATNPTSENNFLWFNAGLPNKAATLWEYPVEHIYRHTLSKESITSYLENYLVFVPAREEINEEGNLIKENSKTIFPRYHQFRSSRNLAMDVKEHVNNNLQLGKKYLINHSAGSGKTLTIAWMADMLDSLYTEDNQKVFDNIIILTDRKSLDKNITDDLMMFSHLKEKINFSKKSRDLANFLEKDRDIIVSTIHKFSHIQEKLQNDEILKKRKVAFLIDEAHRSQDGKLAVTMRTFFNNDSEDDDEEDEELKRLNISNQVFVAFTATTTPKAVSYFGEPFDLYSEEEAIAEGYILDVAQNIISYETLYNLRLRVPLPDEKDFPIGTVSKALKNIAFENEDIIQYKSEVITNLFEARVAQTVGGKGKAMVVTSSRASGYMYYKTIKTILEEKELPFKVLYAFSDFTDKTSGKKIEEVRLNKLDTEHGGSKIEDVFKLPEYRIMVVANKFQTGFNQPLLSAMFLDKSISGVNAIQTVSRLNRKHPEKEQDDILVVDFTNNSNEIFSAFNKHRSGSPFSEKEPNMTVLQELYQEILGQAIFTTEEIELYINAYLDAEIEARKRNSTPDAALSGLDLEYRSKFRERLPHLENQKIYVSLLRRYYKLYHFIAQFFELNKTLNEFVVFAGVMGHKLIKNGKTSEMKKFLENVVLHKGAVKYKGESKNPHPAKDPKKAGLRIGAGGQSPPRSTIEATIASITERFPISNEDALVIKEICIEVSNNYEIKDKVLTNRDNQIYLKTSARPRINQEVKNSYITRDLIEKLDDPIYRDKGGIITLMGRTIMDSILERAN